MQCGEKHCWCAFLDGGFRIQTIPFVGRNESLTCPKLSLFGKDPCLTKPTPIVTCKNTRSSRLKWLYDPLQQKCVLTESCSGFKEEQLCRDTCGKCLILLLWRFVPYGTYLFLRFNFLDFYQILLLEVCWPEEFIFSSGTLLFMYFTPQRRKLYRRHCKIKWGFTRGPWASFIDHSD